MSRIIKFLSLSLECIVPQIFYQFLSSGFSHDDLIEPIAVAVNNKDEVLIADNGVGSILVFESCGKLKKKIGARGKKAGEFKELSSVCIGPEGEIIVADTRIIIFSAAGQFLRELGGGASSKEVGAKGRYTGVSVDRHGHLLAAKTEKTKSYIQVCFPYFHSFALPSHLV